MNFNIQQRKAIDFFTGPCLITACPGSGKTSVLTERSANLVSRGVEPRQIICITFTNKAAREMKERIEAKLSDSQDLAFIGTIHSLSALLLRKCANKVGLDSNFTIIDSDDQKNLIAQCARQLGLDISRDDVSYVAFAVNNWRENLQSQIELEDKFKKNPMLLGVAEEYLKRLKVNNSVDFSGILYDCVKMLEANPDIAERVQEKMKFIQVDEVQDTNLIQFHFINILAKKHRNVVICGDLDQSIYRFRGARYQNILDFLTTYPDCTQINLGKNYRSTPQIVKAAGKLIKHNSSHMGGLFETDNKDGEPVRVIDFEDQVEEAEWVASQIKKLMVDGGWDAEDVAVLYRLNSMSRAIEAALSARGIKYRVVAGRSFYDRAEIKDCISMLRFLANPQDGISFHRVSKVVGGIGDVTIGAIENIARANNCSIYEACAKEKDTSTSVRIRNACKRICEVFDPSIAQMDAASALSELTQKMNYDKFIDSKYDAQVAEDRKNNVKELIDSAALFSQDEKDINKYLQMISLSTTEEEDEDPQADRGVSLITGHSSKGLEFNVVFLVGNENGILPHAMSLAEPGGLEEERRLFFVMMTRAKKILYLTHCKTRKVFGKGGMKTKYCKQSQFIKEAGL